MNEHERILTVVLAFCATVAFLVGLVTPGMRDVSVVIGLGALIALVLSTERIYGWCDARAQKASSFGWYVFWELASMPFGVMYVLFFGVAPERH